MNRMGLLDFAVKLVFVRCIWFKCGFHNLFTVDHRHLGKKILKYGGKPDMT